MARWTIDTAGVHGTSRDAIEAEYVNQTDDGQFLQFKDSAHKTVYMVRSAATLSVTRMAEVENAPCCDNARGVEVRQHFTGTAAEVTQGLQTQMGRKLR